MFKLVCLSTGHIVQKLYILMYKKMLLSEHTFVSSYSIVYTKRLHSLYDKDLSVPAPMSSYLTM